MDNPIKKEYKKFLINKKILLEKQKCCQKCSSDIRLEVDHIIPLFKKGTHELSNLQVLCHKCHKEKTVEDGWNYKYGTSDFTRAGRFKLSFYISEKNYPKYLEHKKEIHQKIRKIMLEAVGGE